MEERRKKKALLQLERDEQKAFDRISKTCPWRYEEEGFACGGQTIGSMQDDEEIGLFYMPCSKDNCALWHFRGKRHIK